jgi:hypothetical protein
MTRALILLALAFSGAALADAPCVPFPQCAPKPKPRPPITEEIYVPGKGWTTRQVPLPPQWVPPAVTPGDRARIEDQLRQANPKVCTKAKPCGIPEPGSLALVLVAGVAMLRRFG